MLFRSTNNAPPWELPVYRINRTICGREKCATSSGFCHQLQWQFNQELCAHQGTGLLRIEKLAATCFSGHYAIGDDHLHIWDAQSRTIKKEKSGQGWAHPTIDSGLSYEEKNSFENSRLRPIGGELRDPASYSGKEAVLNSLEKEDVWSHGLYLTIVTHCATSNFSNYSWCLPFSILCDGKEWFNEQVNY